VCRSAQALGCSQEVLRKQEYGGSVNQEAWPIIFGYLLDLRSDDVVRVVSRAGLNVDWTLSEREAYSHSTRVRAYGPRVQSAFDALDPSAQLRVLAALSAEVIRLHPRSDELQAVLAQNNDQAKGQTDIRELTTEIVPRGTTDTRKVFVVHGRDLTIRQSLF